MIKQIFLKSISICFLVILFFAFTSCESEKRPEEIVGEIPEVVSFSDHIIPIFEGTSVNIEITGKGRACIDCHNGKTPPNLTADNAYIELVGANYINVDNPESSKLYEEIAYGSMNSYTNVTDIAFVLEWITQGAEDN